MNMIRRALIMPNSCGYASTFAIFFPAIEELVRLISLEDVKMICRLLCSGDSPLLRQVAMLSDVANASALFNISEC